MTRHDLFDQPVTLTDAAAICEWNGMIRAFLAHGAATPIHLGKLLELAPDHGAAYAIKGLFYALLGRRELMADAAAACDRAETLAEGVAFVTQSNQVEGKDVFTHRSCGPGIHEFDEPTP